MATLTAIASVPLSWQVTPRNPAPVTFDRHHGETLDFHCTFAGWEGRAPSRPFADTADIRLWYQTNGMGAAWWSLPATVSSNVLSASFPPQADPGADRLALFFGSPSNAYASAVLRLRPSPGFAPNVLPPPDATSWATELAALRSLIDYSPSNSTLVATIAATEKDPTVPAWAKVETPPTNGIPESVAAAAHAASNYTDAAIAAFTPTPSGRSWNRPAEWSLGYAPVFSVESLGLVSFTTNEYGMVFSNFTARTQSGLSARVYPVSLDGLAEATPLPVSLSIPGGTVEGAVVSVPSNGLYAVTGVNSRGEARRIPVPFSFGSVRNVETSAYIADEDGTARKAANDFSATALASMTDAGTAAYIGETNRFRVWRTIQPTFSWPGVGNTTPFAVAPRVMATAAHYSEGMVWTGSLSLTNWVDGGSFTVTRGTPVKLAEWAATNGFTAADIAAAGDLSDIRMIPLTSGEIPTNCCPWFASVEWMAAHYGNLRGLCAWSITQGSWWHPPGNAMQWAIPVVLRGGSLTAANTWMSAGGLKSGDIQPRADIAAAIGTYNVNGWYEIRGGDSGKPVWICDHTTGARRDIIVSHFHTVGSGPNYAAAMPLIRAYCIAHGTNIKEMN